MSHKLNLFDGNQLAAVARLFSASVFQEMARYGASPMFARLARESTISQNISETLSVGEFFEFAFAILSKKAYRYEYAYRAAITHKLLLGTHSLKTASMLTEFRTENCKADIVILNGTSTVYEIKSERDNLDRLDRQMSAYRKVFAKVNIITGENHISAILEKVPDDIGVLVLSDRFRISTIREAVDRPDCINPVSVLDSLQRHEAIQILERMGEPVPQVPNTKMYQALRLQFEKISPTATHHHMLQVLKKTRSLLPLADFSMRLPSSLRPAALSTSISVKDHSKVLSAVRTPISEALRWA